MANDSGLGERNRMRTYVISNDFPIICSKRIQLKYEYSELLVVHCLLLSYILPKCNVRLTWFGCCMPSYIVSDCHDVGFCGSCKSVRKAGL